MLRALDLFRYCYGCKSTKNRGHLASRSYKRERRVCLLNRRGQRYRERLSVRVCDYCRLECPHYVNGAVSGILEAVLSDHIAHLVPRHGVHDRTGRDWVALLCGVYALT